jgi:hypothetical protein
VHGARRKRDELRSLAIYLTLVCPKLDERSPLYQDYCEYGAYKSARSQAPDKDQLFPSCKNSTDRKDGRRSLPTRNRHAYESYTCKVKLEKGTETHSRRLIERGRISSRNATEYATEYASHNQRARHIWQL